ncbi:hypothetical protein AB0D97_08275 [Streptomyces roseus]|uniref:hypothetical protein n=1 Tax=Streptomyces roseus TaxID=66430 RepID=UPI0033D1B9AF
MHRITRYTLPAALCVTLISVTPGLAGAADAPTKASAPVSKKAIPGAEALTAQVASLGAAGSMLTPVTNFLGEVLKSPDGKLPEADLAAHKQKIDAALASMKKTFAAAAAPAAAVKPPATVPVTPVVLPNKPADEPPGAVAKPPVEAAKPPVEAAKPPVEAAKPPVEAAKPPVEAAKPPVEAAKPPVDAAKPVEAAKPPVEAAKPPMEAAKPPVEAAKPPVEAAKPPVDALKPAAPAVKPPAAPVAKPPAAVAQPVTLPAVAPAVAAKPRTVDRARVDRVTAAVDHLKVSVDEVFKAAGTTGTTGAKVDAKAEATDVVNDLGATMVALFTGLGLPGMPAAAPAPAPAE